MKLFIKSDATSYRDAPKALSLEGEAGRHKHGVDNDGSHTRKTIMYTYRQHRHRHRHRHRRSNSTITNQQQRVVIIKTIMELHCNTAIITILTTNHTHCTVILFLLFVIIRGRSRKSANDCYLFRESSLTGSGGVDEFEQHRCWWRCLDDGIVTTRSWILSTTMTATSVTAK